METRILIKQALQIILENLYPHYDEYPYDELDLIFKEHGFDRTAYNKFGDYIVDAFFLRKCIEKL